MKTQESTGLRATLSRRQISMIAIGGVIGAGFFVGSGTAIAAAGPAVLIGYVVAGIIVVLVMRMLGEMAVAHPDTGSFSVYADRSIGRWAGFTIGWLYTWFWLLAISAEAIAGARIAHLWWTAVPEWAWMLILIAVLTLSNLISVRFYGEFEFWFAAIKVVAIIVFIVIAVLALCGFWPGLPSPGLHNLLGEGGFAPNGLGPVFGALPIIIFSFFGSEIATIAAGESAHPAQAVTAAVRSVIARIIVFYLGGIFLIVALKPWSDPAVQTDPFLSTALLFGIPHTDLVVSIIIFVAVLSCLNSATYTASRMIYSLADRGDAPRIFLRTSPGGTPWIAVLLCTAVGVVTSYATYLFPGEVFGLVLGSSGGVGVFVWLVIAISQYLSRRQARRSGQVPKLKMWGFPTLTLVVIAALTALVVLCLLLPERRIEMIASTALALVLTVIGLARRGLRRSETPATPTTRSGTPE